MFLFSLKKWFLNYWDNLTLFILLNVISGIILLVAVALPFMNMLPFLGFLGFVLLECTLVFLLSFLTTAAMGLGKRADKADSPKFMDLKKSIKTNLGICVKGGVMSILTFIVCVIVIPFYFETFRQSAGENTVAGIITGVLITILVFWMLVGQFIIPIMIFNKVKFTEATREAMLLTLDNLGFSFVTALMFWLITGVSLITAFILPGYITASYYVLTSYRLRMYKYSYLNENPGKKFIPWKSLLVAENEKLGKRTLRGFFNLE